MFTPLLEFLKATAPPPQSFFLREGDKKGENNVASDFFKTNAAPSSPDFQIKLGIEYETY